MHTCLIIIHVVKRHFCMHDIKTNLFMKMSLEFSNKHFYSSLLYDLEKSSML